jgi:hypothetical protein
MISCGPMERYCADGVGPGIGAGMGANSESLGFEIVSGAQGDHPSIAVPKSKEFACHSSWATGREWLVDVIQFKKILSH